MHRKIQSIFIHVDVVQILKIYMPQLVNQSHTYISGESQKTSYFLGTQKLACIVYTWLKLMTYLVK